ncbi:multidrug transporter [Periweissella ghanensis]|uniref:PTS EIIA type-4 domain-containing protein n=1 Tax=Periweissella ghanensis TaxID=467997 RepID=A0ABN8BP77_9LACO|nr:multidrug transporter [Periweissella ghanensis]MCM0601271.1 multidrug transporter [Periweissella ghanensis]CAH0418421.1 hypothetical protein WGH24286_00839 [Periweissella ghanensis]
MQIIVTGYGNFASGIVSSAKAIAGDLVHIQVVDYVAPMDAKALAHRFHILLKHDLRTVFFCDIVGGIPFRQAVLAKGLPNADITVMAGGNISGLLAIAWRHDINGYLNTESLAKALVSASEAGLRIDE